MSDSDLIVSMTIMSMAAVLLVGSRNVELRTRHREGGYPVERQWPGHGIDVTRMAERIQRVRNDYVSELETRPRRISQQKDLLASVRKVVGRLPYFQKASQTSTDYETSDPA